MSLEYSGAEVRYQRQLLTKRRLLRAEEKEREDEEELRNNDFGALLEVEKAARVNAEEKAATLVRQREVEEKKMKELENIREQVQ